MNSRKAQRAARVVVLALAVLVALGLLGIVGYVWDCGTERWSVKVGIDPDGWQVDLSNAVWTSVSEMNTFPGPGSAHAA
jgi:hypothetical protein